ncbi:MAG: polysaccharide pyruvyl transferase family protein [Xanthobacteraceae bacterium]|nr:polysaccharide pyruvyl transferase family protein [Xanthobacteraceae bacterium]
MKIFLLGATPSFKSDPSDTPIAKLGKTGGNTGNQIIAHALLSQIEHDEVAWEYSVDPREVGERYDMIVIAAANFLFRSFDFGGMAEYIEQANLPVAIVGLGAQSSSYDPDIELHPGTERFVKVIAERAVRIGVRGPYTREVLARRGVHNVTVTGCPSYYMRRSPSLMLTKREFNAVERIAVNASRDVVSHAFDADKMANLVRGIYREAVNRDADFIAQSEHPEIILASGSPEERNRACDEVVSALDGVAERGRLAAWARDHVKVFFDVDDWIDAIRGYDFVFGHRFHGNMIALQHGVPACVICHDTRTEDMCRFLGMPYVNIFDLETIDVRELYNRVDCAALEERYKVLFPQYMAFLRQNGLTPRAAVPQLSAAE